MNRVVHLVRHGEVENPDWIIYGKEPGFDLSLRGRMEAVLASRLLATVDVGLIVASPMERTRETASILAEPHGLPISIDNRLTELDSAFSGLRLRSHKSLSSLINRLTLRPWVESREHVAERALPAIREALTRTDREVVVITHRGVVRALYRTLVPHKAFMGCPTGAVTTLMMDDNCLVALDHLWVPRLPGSKRGFHVA